jgi:hypothetical protein
MAPVPSIQPVGCACRSCGHAVGHLHAHYPFCSQACRMRDPEYGPAKPHGRRRPSPRSADRIGRLVTGKGDSAIMVCTPDGWREFIPG